MRHRPSRLAERGRITNGPLASSNQAIVDARRDARKRFGPAGVVSIRRVTTPRICHGCDSQPCCCKRKQP